MKVLATLVVLLVARTAQAQLVVEMTPAKIKEALADKKGTGCYEIKRGMSKFSWGGPAVGCFSTPYSRVVEQRAYRTKRYLPFTEADVTSALIAAGEVHVFAYPLTPSGKPNNVVAVVVGPHKTKEGAGVIQPTSAEEISTDYKNLLGATFEGRGLRAVFPLNVLTEENEFRVVFDTGEEKAKIKMEGVK